MTTLFMVKIGATPKGRLIEQHDMFFGVANEVDELIPAIDNHWPEAKGIWHYDAYRAVTKVDNYHIQWLEDSPDNVTDYATDNANELKLWFINFGGYLPQHFEEYHHKVLVVAPTQAEAITQAKKCDFYKQYTFKDKTSRAIPAVHVDDKMQIAVDDIYDVNSLLSSGYLHITPVADDHALPEDQQVIGYVKVPR